jgi:hypothetical protein|tara:strand:- start:247 stop:459 length:213 start_codon:yes stop_codon:yes gene_type:complete
MRKFVSVGEDRYHILAEIPINPDINLKRLKISYNADTILQNDETYYPARKMIDVDIEENTEWAPRVEFDR